MPIIAHSHPWRMHSVYPPYALKPFFIRSHLERPL